MKVLSPDDAGAWLKGKQAAGARRPGGAAHVTVYWPEEPARLREFAARLADMSNWSGAGLIFGRPGMPRDNAVADVCKLHREFGYFSSPADVKAGPGHVFEDASAPNRAAFERLLVAVMSGYLEGRLVTKNARFLAVFGCGVIDFYSADKSLSGKLRTLVRDLGLNGG